MDFELNEEQEMLRKFARDFMTGNCPSEYVRAMEEDENGFTAGVWRGMAELGWMGLVIPEKYGGQGMSFIDLTVLLEEMGRSCMPGSFFSTVVLGAMTLLDLAGEDRKKALLPGIARGDTRVTLALTEAAGSLEPNSIRTTATIDGDGYVINGTKMFVPDFGAADYVICVARTQDGSSGEGITLFLIDAKTRGITCTPLKTIGSDKQAEVVFDHVNVPAISVIGELHKAWNAIEKVINRAAIAKCAEMVGGAQRVLEMTIEYAKERMQFNRPIGSFQAIQHHCANIATDVVTAKYVTNQAAWMFSEDMPCDPYIAMAKSWCSDAYRRVVTMAHSVHGAVGFTLDHDLALYYRRAKAAEVAFGDSDFHRDKLASQIGL